MAYDKNNAFARILRGELPCIKVFEDEHTLALMDIMPQVDGHVLIVQVNGAEVGQTVPHVHFHVMPRTSNEALRPHVAQRETPERLQAFAERIIAALAAN